MIIGFKYDAFPEVFPTDQRIRLIAFSEFKLKLFAQAHVIVSVQRDSSPYLRHKIIPQFRSQHNTL